MTEDEITDKKLSRRQFVGTAAAGVAVAAGGALLGPVAIHLPAAGEARPELPVGPKGRLLTAVPAQALGTVAEVTKETVTFNVNGNAYTLEIGSQVFPYTTLVYTLRDELGLTGTKLGCNKGPCGACTVLADGDPVLACKTLTVECGDKNITTVEGLATGTILNPLQQSFVDDIAMQCGFCIPGYLMSATALLSEIPNPTLDQVRQGVSGNICRCGSQMHIYQAVLDAAAAMEGGA